MPTLKPITRRDLITLALILFVAALMRFTEPGIVEFRLDEATLSLKALDWLDGGAFPLTGIPSSVGIPNPPINVYVMTLPYLFTDNPLLATLFVAALNVVGVGLLWWIARRYLGPLVALTAGLAYAINPWAVLYSRKIWAQDFHTPLFLLALLLGLYGFVEGKRWAQVFCLPLLIAALQIHFAAWALLPLYGWLLWVGRKRLSLPALAVSVGLAALTLAPFAAGLQQTLDDDPEVLGDLLKRGGGLSVSADSLIAGADFATGLGVETQVAPEHTDELLTAVPAQSQVWMLLGVLTVIGLVGVWTVTYRHFAVLLTAWALFPIIVFVPTWTPFYPHYLIATIPALSLLTGVGLAWLVGRLPGKSISRTIALTGFCVLLLSQAIWWRGLLRYVDSTYSPNGFGTPLHNLLTLRDFLARYENLVVVSDGMEVLYDQEPAIWSVLWHDHNHGGCLRAVERDGLAVFPNGKFVVLYPPNVPEDSINGIYQTNDRLEFQLRPDEGAYTIHLFASPLSWTGLPMTALPPARFDNGAQLAGYTLGNGLVMLEWLLPSKVSADYHYFVHLLDASGEKIAQHDDAFLPGRFWCDGDRVVTWGGLDIPDNAITLRVGLYRFEHHTPVNSAVIDAQGNPAASWVDVGMRKAE